MLIVENCGSTSPGSRAQPDSTSFCILFIDIVDKLWKKKVCKTLLVRRSMVCVMFKNKIEAHDVSNGSLKSKCSDFQIKRCNCCQTYLIAVHGNRVTIQESSTF